MCNSCRRISSDHFRLWARELGHPYLVCFKTCITLISKELDDGNFPSSDQIAVFLDRNSFEMEAVRIFDELKGNPDFPYRSRLHSCTPSDMESLVPLQASDLIAYEGFRWHHDRRRTADSTTRIVMKAMQDHNGMTERYYGTKTLSNLKEGIESVVCLPNSLVVLPKTPETVAE